MANWNDRVRAKFDLFSLVVILAAFAVVAIVGVWQS